MELEPMFSGQSTDELFVGIGFGSSQSVVEMNHREHDAKLLAQFEQQAQECNRIQSAGDSHADALTRMQEFMLAEMDEELVGKRRHQQILHGRQWLNLSLRSCGSLGPSVALPAGTSLCLTNMR